MSASRKLSSGPTGVTSTNHLPYLYLPNLTLPYLHQADVDSLVRLINVHNVLHATNPTTALALMHSLKLGVEGQPELIPSFFRTLASPAVAEYKAGKAALLANLAKEHGDGGEPPAATPRV